MSIQNHFEKFYENIKLTPSQRKDAKTKYIGVCKKLHEHYYPDFGYTGSTKLLIGSYAKKTHIRPARDIDVIFIMPQEKFEQYNDNQSNGQSQLLNDVKKILEEKYPDTPIKAFGKVVVVEFADTQHKIELLPAWEKDSGHFIIPNSENGGSWEDWDPRSEIQKINDSNLKTGKTRALVRMIKKWTENCTVKLKSHAIENEVLSFLDTAGSLNDEYSFLLKDLFSHFYEKVVDENLKSHLNTALNRARKACEYEENNNLDKAVIEWVKIFGEDFPKSMQKSDLSKLQGVDEKFANLSILYPSAKEEFLDKDYGIKFAIDPANKIEIDAKVEQSGFRPAFLSNFLEKRFPLKKKKKLFFSIVKNNISKPYSVMWKVRNFGEEAKDDLRGEITNDRGFEAKSENTRYYGEHYVECYIVKNNQCVSMDRILVPIGVD